MVRFGPRWISPPQVSYGEHIVRITIGSGLEKKTFTAHKALISAASPFFDRNFNTPDKEAKKQMLALPDDLPGAFDLIHRWLYSGIVHDASCYIKSSTMHHDHFWLQVYLLADCLFVKAIQIIAFERFESIFPFDTPIIPSIDYIEALYNLPAAPAALQVYTAKHAAFFILDYAQTGEAWTALLESQDRFGRNVSVQIVKLASLRAESDENFDLEHPAYSRGEFAKAHGLDLNAMRRETKSWMCSSLAWNAENDGGRVLETADELLARDRPPSIEPSPPARTFASKLAGALKRPLSASEAGMSGKKAKQNGKKTSDHSEESQDLTAGHNIYHIDSDE